MLNNTLKTILKKKPFLQIKFECITNILSKNYSKNSNLKFDHDANILLTKHDKTQVSLLQEKCILVDENDCVIGSESKKNCHLLNNIDKGMLHRAFSIFLFDEKNRLLLQQRSDFKITYPSMWTNTCCSHPLYCDEELDNETGIKSAARRRLLYEFGINVNDINLFKYITRIQYKAINEPYDGVFGEHEIDYILFLKGNYSINYNKNEIKAYKYIAMDDLKDILDKKPINNETFLNEWKFTPWFKMICNNQLFKWWLNLDKIDNFYDHKTIHKLI